MTAMNANATIDTHAVFRRLKTANFDDAQAEAIVEAVQQSAVLPDISQLATKADLQVLESKLDAKIAESSNRQTYLIVGAAAVTVISQWLPHFIGK